MNGTIDLAAGSLVDLPGVMKVMEAAFEPCFGEAWTASQCAGLLPMPGVWLTLARQNGDVLGFALSRVVAGEAELLLLAVDPHARGRGVGRSLLSHFQAAARARGAERLHLEVRDGNAAVNLYEASGFTIVGRRRNYYSGADGQVYDALSLGRPALSEAAI
jgi:[ribosomal protein S18]-alanine N-acetyltransferase